MSWQDTETRSISTTLALASAASTGIIPIVYTAFLVLVAMLLANLQGTDLNSNWTSGRAL